MGGRNAVAESGAHALAVQAFDCGVDDELYVRAGNELVQLGRGARADVDAGGGENRAVEVASTAVGDLVVERASLLEQRVEALAILRQRAAAAGHSPPRLVRGRLQQQRERVLGERGPRLSGRESSASELDDGGWPAREEICGSALLEHAELRFAALLEQLGDRLARGALDDVVDRDERAPEPRGEPGAERRLPRAHESDQGEMAVQRVQRSRGQRIRSR